MFITESLFYRLLIINSLLTLNLIKQFMFLLMNVYFILFNNHPNKILT